MTEHKRFDLLGPLPTGRVAIEASAGTGKTFTLAGLAVRYVAEAPVPISELLVVTFTRAAAAELRHRVRTRLTEAARALRGSAGSFDDELHTLLGGSERELRADRLEAAVTDFDAATITTIHGFAQQVLTTLGSTAPGDLDATLVDDARELVTQVCADVLAATAVDDPFVVDELPKHGRLIQLVLTVLGNPGLAIVPSAETEDSSEVSARYRRLVDRAVDEVQRRRREAGTVSFDDVLTQLRDALRHSPAAAASLQRRYQVALIDEFQDTDPVQWQIFSTLFGGPKSNTSLVLVGDPKQAIYAFRGANVHTYLEAAYEPGTERSTLGVNWRSDQALLGALERMLAGATFGDARIGFVDVETAPEHVDRRLHTANGTTLPALAVRAALGDDLPRNQTGTPPPIKVEEGGYAIARDLARQVQTLLEDAYLPGAAGATGARVRPHDIAVLVGTHADATVMQTALLRRGIPAVAHRGGSVLESPAAVQWRWLLTALARPSDPSRARTAALSWFFGWSADHIDTARDDDLAAVQEQLYRWAEILESRGAVDFCAHVWSESDVTTRVLETPDGDRNLTDLDHLAQLLEATASGHRPGPVALLAALALLDEANKIELENDVTARRIESEAEAVQVMTVYAAKGLEFPVVCVPTLWKNNFSRRECIYQDPDTGARTLDVTKAITRAGVWPTKAESEARKALAEREAVGENLRLLYVALTRAQHQTIVWWSRGQSSDATGLARVLFARDDAGVLQRDLFEEKKVPLPPDPEAVARLAPVFAPVGDAVTLTETGMADGFVPRWNPGTGDTSPPRLALAELGRVVARPHRRWSFSAISDRAHDFDWDPDDDSLGDSGAADEPADPQAEEAIADPLVTDLPLGAMPAGVSFGSMVHELLEDVDFAAADLDAELQARIDQRRRWNPAPVLGAELLAGLRAAIETPLGPLFDGRRLRDLARVDRLDELSFELRLGEAGRHATDRDIGALMADHLTADDPLRPWAEQLAAGLFDVSLAGHLTGSIDAIFRITDPTELFAPSRFVLADYKTNLLAERGRPPQAADYHPDRLPAAMKEHHYPLQALLYSVVLHRYLRWRVPDYDPAVNFGGAAYLFLRGMTGADTPTVAGHPYGVFGWAVPPALVTDLSDLLDGQLRDGRLVTA
jgi:exodeoxyribonuclease V beta subunit